MARIANLSVPHRIGDEKSDKRSCKSSLHRAAGSRSAHLMRPTVQRENVSPQDGGLFSHRTARARNLSHCERSDSPSDRKWERRRYNFAPDWLNGVENRSETT